MTEKKTGVIFGAGTVGRGFLGQLFSESGYEVVFVDVDEALVETLAQRGSYKLRLAGIDRTEDRIIGQLRVLCQAAGEDVVSAVAEASLLGVATETAALPVIGASIAAGLTRRWRENNPAPLNILICVDHPEAPEMLAASVEAALGEVMAPHLRQRVGFVPAVVGRMSPLPTPHLEADPTLIVVEPYKLLPVDRAAFVGPIPAVTGLLPVSPFRAYEERKLYIHNAAHATLGYLGYSRGSAYGYEALEDPWVRPLLTRALDEASWVMVIRHGFEPVSFREHVDYLLVRFANRALADPVERLCRDPLRKLAPDERLVGIARLAQQHGIQVDGLAWGIATALAYDNPDDLQAVDLQERLAREGLEGTLAQVSGIQPGESLADLVKDRYWALRDEPWRLYRGGLGG